MIFYGEPKMKKKKKEIFQKLNGEKTTALNKT